MTEGTDLMAGGLPLVAAYPAAAGVLGLFQVQVDQGPGTDAVHLLEAPPAHGVRVPIRIEQATRPPSTN